MKIDTSLGYSYWINTVASILDNPVDSINSLEEMAEAVAEAFDTRYYTVLGHAIGELAEPKEAKWEIVS